MKVYAIAQNRENTDFDIVGDVDGLSSIEKTRLIERIQLLAPFDMATPAKLAIKDGRIVGHFIPDGKGPDGRARCALLMVEDIGEDDLSQDAFVLGKLKGALKELLGSEVSDGRLVQIDAAFQQCKRQQGEKTFFRIVAAGIIAVAAIAAIYLFFRR